MHKIKNSLFKVPQIILLTKGPDFKSAISFFIKKIICLNASECQKLLCKNCEKFANNSFLDLKWIKLASDNFLKKQDSINIMEELQISSIQEKSSKICVIEQIEYGTSEANNVLLKFLENINNNIYLIFTTNNITAVLPTIKSRCQIFDIAIDNVNAPNLINNINQRLLFAINQAFSLGFNDINKEDFQTILNLVSEFIENDNNNELNNNFFLIKTLNRLKQKSILFFKIISLLVESKLLIANVNSEINENPTFIKLLKFWNNDNKGYLLHLMEKIILIEKQFNNKINLNLLLNHFFINICEEINHG